MGRFDPLPNWSQRSTTTAYILLLGPPHHLTIQWVTWMKRSYLVLRGNFELRPDSHKILKWQQQLVRSHPCYRIRILSLSVRTSHRSNAKTCNCLLWYRDITFFSWEKSLFFLSRFSLNINISNQNEVVCRWLYHGLRRYVVCGATVRINCDLTCERFFCARVLDIRSVLIWTSVWSGNLLSSEVISLTHCIIKWWGGPSSKNGVTWPRFVRQPVRSV